MRLISSGSARQQKVGTTLRRTAIGAVGVRKGRLRWTGVLKGYLMEEVGFGLGFGESERPTPRACQGRRRSRGLLFFPLSKNLLKPEFWSGLLFQFSTLRTIEDELF
jgi:hypothetical protein